MAEQENTATIGSEHPPVPTGETTAVTVLPAHTPVQNSEPNDTQSYSFRAYDHGFTNGLLRIEAQDFETFAEESEKLRFIRHQLYLVETEIQELRDTKATVTSERLRLTQARLEAEARQQTLQLQLQRAEEKRQANRASQVAIDEAKQDLKPPYAWPPAILYLLAGFVFIMADIAVMHEIAKDGLNLSGTYEPWLFAVGLAFVAFLVKPAIDRILEKPYEREQNVKRNHTVLVVFAGAALLTLGIMGYFRSEATSIKNQKEELESQLLDVQLRKGEAENASQSTTELDKEQKTIEIGLQELENKRADSTSMRISLVLASMLFAIAGAVCLGIAFPAINKLHRSQFVLRNRLRKLVRSGLPLEEAVTALETQLAEEQQKQQLLLFTFQELADLPTLTTRLGALQARDLVLRQELVLCQAARHRSLYRDGKARGEIYELQGTLSYSVTDADRRVAESHSLEGSAATASASPEEDARRTGKRPYVVLRRLISKHYTRHRQNEQAEAIEIE
ncbi:hypothetical protein ACFPAF_04235 [Hymenobacter endophyticus]|uniref:Uncharacterized protein n=1 Tax=Hymenobacter endophyticus TaxID=3076335 RepID=A0ABU3TDY9_9BACT|nr:hypothetical protein [Hymenobacter endophyticus]MDU0369593.1 hypothetical protein [Hymenobacter endophyticus]